MASGRRSAVADMGAVRPTGTVTFLFSDIEASTTRWEAYPDAMVSVMSRHDALMRRTIEAHGGYVFKTVGDAFCAAFKAAAPAIDTAIDAQRAMLKEDWSAVDGLAVRIALHCGVAEERDGDYFGPSVNRVARLLSLGHGGQIILSEVAANLAKARLPSDATLRDLGSHRLRDIAEPEHVFQLDAPGLRSDFPPLVASATLPGEFPRQLTSFIGRETELREIHELIKRSRLVTLIGAGGVGKTRLATRVASEATTAFSAGAGFIDLVPISSPDHLPYAVLAALRLPEDGRPIEQRLSDVIGDATALLVFDNCERLLPASALLIADLLGALPGLHVLATSRETLDLPGESVYRVQPLATESAVALFLDRARAVNATFGRNGGTPAHVERLCKGLDGIPLALEIAASRANVLSPQQIAARLSDRLSLLVDRRGHVPPHHHTMRQTLDWSFELLDAAERVLFRRLSVFVDGWTLEAAEAICPAGSECADVLNGLSRLVDKSLVVANIAGAITRFNLLETVREYAHSKLIDSGEEHMLRAVHRRFYRELLERCLPDLRGPGQLDAMECIGAEDGNVTTAIEGALEANDTAEAVSLALAASEFWWISGGWDRARMLLGKVQAFAAGSLPRLGEAALLYWRAQFAWLQGDFREAAALNDVALQVRLELGSDQEIADSLFMKARDVYAAGDFPGCRALAEDALARYRRAGNEHSAARVLDFLGLIHTVLQSYAEAERLFLESLAILQQFGDERLAAWVQYHRGYRAESLGDYEAAERLARESLEQCERTHDQHGTILSLQNVANAVGARGDRVQAIRLHRQALGLAHRFGLRKDMIDSLERLGAFVAEEDPAQSVRLLAAADRLREQLRMPLQDPERRWYDPAMHNIRQRVDVKAFDHAWNAGRELSVDKFMNEVLAATASAA